MDALIGGESLFTNLTFTPASNTITSLSRVNDS